MLTTTHYGLNIVEGTDVVNPLVQQNPNYTAIDAAMFANKQGSIGSGTELTAGTVHTITRANTDSNYVRFTATSNWTAGDSMVVDSTPVSVYLSDGTTPATGAYVINTEVLILVNGSRVTLINSGYPVASQSENGLMSAADKTKLDNIIASGAGYIKYGDGTMICWGSVNGNCHTWSAWGSLYQSNNVPLGQFPVPFTSTPIVTISGYNSATGGWLTPVNSVTATDVGIFSVVRPNDPGVQPFQVSYIAIGKWN